jgi:ubiquinone/menaquinone biosynthesis C-methylase UbiE
MDRLVDMNKKNNVLVIGCGPRPKTIKFLLEKGFSVTGIEPHGSFVKSAREYLGAADLIKIGWAEELPLFDNSQDIIFMESILEHVVSPMKSLHEAFRVQASGGVLYVTTSNRLKFRPSGRNGEFNVRFFNYFPRVLKESYIFQQLHFKPELANYTTWPAVHWYTYAELCGMGREAGYEKFYSLIDLMRTKDPGISRSLIRRMLLKAFQSNPWLRSISLTQLGGTIFMLKRA